MNQTSIDAVLEPIEAQLLDHDTVVDVDRNHNDGDISLVATVIDRVAVETLRADLNEMLTPVYVDIRPAS